MARFFDRTGVGYGPGAKKPGYELKCSMCRTADSVVAAGHAGNLPPEMVRKKFTERGWEVGTSPKGDLCPACIKKASKRKVEPIAGAFSKAGLIIMTPEQAPKVTAEPPREMSREDSRIVVAKLNEIYIDERTGYDKGWSDERVAKDLGVPRAWVSKLREEIFGPAFDSEMADAVKQAEVAIKAAEVIENRLSDAYRQASEIVAAAGNGYTKVKDDLLTAMVKLQEARARFGR